MTCYAHETCPARNSINGLLIFFTSANCSDGGSLTMGRTGVVRAALVTLQHDPVYSSQTPLSHSFPRRAKDTPSLQQSSSQAVFSTHTSLTTNAYSSQMRPLSHQDHH